MPHKDPERRREWSKAYYAKNKERHNAYQRAYYQANKDRYRERILARHEQDLEYKREYYKRKKAYWITRRYGLTPQERLELFESSDGLCALCYEAPATHIDHDHETSRVRGALCQPCNQGLGHVERMGATSSAIEEYLSTEWRLDVS